MTRVLYPSLYQINTRVYLKWLSGKIGHAATFDDIPDSVLDEWRSFGFDWIWMLGVWQTGDIGRDVSRTNPEWRREFEHTLSDLTEDDIQGSPFAIQDYRVHEAIGGNASLARLRRRLNDRGMKLMLDFVPNHVAQDHAWVAKHPEWLIQGDERLLCEQPKNYFRTSVENESRVFAFGRDPYFDGWPDTFQLNYANAELQQAMQQELLRVADCCDGVRCDMAMLLIPEVFYQTWQRFSRPFWPDAIASVRAEHPDFTFMAEVYWDLEWELQQQGFDFAYDKRLYDRLRVDSAREVRAHLTAGLDFQSKLARFLENHDEPRAAETFPEAKHFAAAAITFLSPGLRFFHQGQFEGNRARISPHLVRGPMQPINQSIESFYRSLLSFLGEHQELRTGDWSLVDFSEAWPGNWTNIDFVGYRWKSKSSGTEILVIVNYSDHQSQAIATVEECGEMKFFNATNGSFANHEGIDLSSREVRFDFPAWGIRIGVKGAS